MDLTPYLKKSLAKDKAFKESLEIVRKNAGSGNIWAIGGIVYRSIINELEGRESTETFDFDFIVENPVNIEDIEVPRGWTITKTNLDCPRLINGKKQIDIIPLSEISAKKRFGWEATIENYFKQVPLTIQAIAYDLSQEKIVGEIGIKALTERKIEVNNLNECRNFCKNRRISIRKFIALKAKSLDFTPVYPTSFKDNYGINETIRFYDISKTEYEKNRIEDYESFTQIHLSNEIEDFLARLKGKRIMDLGCGPGRDSLTFKTRGFYPIGVDLSHEMVAICKQRGVKSYQKDMEDLDFEESSFDGIWAYASLVHLPKFSIYNVLARISEILKKEGLLFLGMLEGEGEVLYEGTNKEKGKRLFSLYEDKELREILSSYFEIVSFSRFNVGEKQKYLNYLCKKK